MRERTKINYAAMSDETKIGIQNIAKILYANGVNIQRYDKTSAILLLQILEQPEQIINIFRNYSYEVFVEIIEIQLTNSHKK